MSKICLRFLTALIFVAGTGGGQACVQGQTPVAVPTVSQIRLPISTIPVVPTAVTELKEDSWFVIEADIPCIVLASRNGFVSIVPEKGPLRLRGKFADGTGKVETRSYTAKSLWIVEAVAPGEVELLIVPNGAVDEAAVIRRTLVVGGKGPQPPPKPDVIVDPTPKPKPDPPTPVAAKVLTIVIVEKAIERTPQSAALIGNLAYWKSLEPTVETVHIVPAGTPIADRYKKQIAEGGGKLPITILMDHETGKVLFSGPLPANDMEMSALINKHTSK